MIVWCLCIVISHLPFLLLADDEAKETGTSPEKEARSQNKNRCSQVHQMHNAGMWKDKGELSRLVIFLISEGP